MLRNIKSFGPIIKNGIGYSFYSGFCCGMIIPNKISVHKHSNEKLKSQIISLPFFPIFSGLICASSFICFPLLFTNYIIGGTYLDKLYDKILEKYSIEIKRYHQYDGTNNKYGYRSEIFIIIDENKKFYQT